MGSIGKLKPYNRAEMGQLKQKFYLVTLLLCFLVNTLIA